MVIAMPLPGEITPGIFTKLCYIVCRAKAKTCDSVFSPKASARRAYHLQRWRIMPLLRSAHIRGA